MDPARDIKPSSRKTEKLRVVAVNKVLGDRRELALLFKTIATLRTDAPLFSDVDELRWDGPADAFGSLPAGFVDDALAGRVAALINHPTER